MALRPEVVRNILGHAPYRRDPDVLRQEPVEERVGTVTQALEERWSSSLSVGFRIVETTGENLERLLGETTGERRRGQTGCFPFGNEGH
jgi:hypothetical protein